MSTISASTTNTTAYKVTADTTGTLVFQTGATPTTAMTLGSDQSVTFAGTPTYSGGTANGVAYLNGSKVLTTGSALVFDGTNLGIGTSSPGYKLDILPASGVSTAARLRGNSVTAGSNNVQLRFYGKTSATDLWAIGNDIATDNGAVAFDFYDLSASALRMRLDSSGNLGLGVTPPTIYTNRRALVIGGQAVASVYHYAGIGESAYNWYLDGSAAVKYATTNYAGTFEFNNSATGGFAWKLAPSGTAGNAITFTQAMTLTSGGNLLVGTTSTPTSGSGNIVAAYATGGGVQIAHSNSGGGGLFVALAGGGVATYTYTGAVGSESYTERARIDSSGNLLVGGTSNAAGARLISENASGNQLGLRYTSVATWYNSVDSSGNYIWTKDGANIARFDSSGNLLVGTTSSPYNVSKGGLLSYLGTLGLADNGGNDVAFICKNGSTAGTLIKFYYNASSSGSASGGSSPGSITTNGTTTAYNISSDYRLKNTIAPMTGALAKLAQLKPVTYKWNADGSDGEGFIAHELAEVVPQCVTGEKDAVDADGNPVYQGIDTSFLVATLTAAIQEQQAIIQSLTARITALEGA